MSPTNTTDGTARRDSRRKLSAQLNPREEEAVAYIQEWSARARELSVLDAGDKPIITSDLPEDVRAELVERIADYELRAELKRTFRTVELPDDKANITRFALRFLAKSLKGAVTRAGLRASEADPSQRAEDAHWSAVTSDAVERSFREIDADADAATEGRAVSPTDFTPAFLCLSDSIEDKILVFISKRDEDKLAIRLTGEFPAIELIRDEHGDLDGLPADFLSHWRVSVAVRQAVREAVQPIHEHIDRLIKPLAISTRNAVDDAQ
ncbi:MAG: hypothetical protein ACOH2Q_07690 [Rhodococcus sp. (in: high G+C Gram-positive bacteria)]